MPEGVDRSGRLAPAARAAGGDADGGPPDVLLTLPNVITLARLCAVPATVWLILHHRFDLALLLFAVAGVSDGIDGWIARRFQARSALGAILDPVADKALVVSVTVTLAAVGALADWLAILVVFRDLLIVGGVLALWLLGEPPAIRPIAISKLNTLLQLALLAFTLGAAAFGVTEPALHTALVWAVAATTLASGAAYVRAGFQVARGVPPL